MSSQPQSVQFVNPPNLPRRVGYSHVAQVRNGTTIYISGQIALDQSGNVVGPNDLRAQTEQVFANLKTALEAVGTDFDKVVKLNYYLLDISQIQIVREVRAQYLNPHHPPTSTAVEVRRLVRDDLMIEVDAVAVIPD